MAYEKLTLMPPAWHLRWLLLLQLCHRYLVMQLDREGGRCGRGDGYAASLDRRQHGGSCEVALCEASGAAAVMVVVVEQEMFKVYSLVLVLVGVAFMFYSRSCNNVVEKLGSSRWC